MFGTSKHTGRPTVFRKALLFVVWCSVVTFSAIANGNEVAQQECSPQLKSSNATVNIALNNLYSYDYVMHALHARASEMRSPIYCVSGVAVSQNNYANKKFIIAIDIRDALDPAPKAAFRFLYQDASVQAHHNVGAKAWAGLDPVAVTSTMSRLVQRKAFNETGSMIVSEQDLIAAAFTSQTFQASQSNMNEKTLAIMPLDTGDSESEFYLVSFLTKPGNNPFSSFVTSKAVLVRKSADGKAAVAESISLPEDIGKPLDSIRISTRTQADKSESDLELLLRLSKK